jgi:TRAP-type C4-dicarboxylate transport system substrate-binding protein
MQQCRAARVRSHIGKWLSLLLAVACAPAHAVDIKIATVAPDGSRWIQQMRAGAEEVNTRTAGRVTIKFYPGGVMGNDAQVLRKIRIGQLQGGAFTAGGLAERYGALNLYGIPLLFRSLDEIDAVRAKLDPELAAGLDGAGFVTFGFIEGGFANVLANEPIHSVEEMRRKKVWVPEGDPISFMVMEALGLSPAVLPVTDVLTGLQTGLIDIAFASPVAALVLQWHTKVKYITEIPVSYSMGIFAIEKAAYSALSAADQQIVREVMTRYIGALDREARDDNRRAGEVLARSGLETVTVNAADVEGWRSTIETIYPRLRARPDIDAATFDRMLALLAEYRRTHP